MASLLSPGVQVNEIDKSLVVSSDTTAYVAFAGTYNKGACNTPVYCTNITDYVNKFGEPDDLNANEFFQVWLSLKRSGGCYVGRAVDTKGIETRELIANATVKTAAVAGKNKVEMNDTTGVFVGQTFMIGEDKTSGIFKVTAVDSAAHTIDFDPAIPTGQTFAVDEQLYVCRPTMSAAIECLNSTSTATISDAEYEAVATLVENDAQWDVSGDMTRFASSESSLRFIARTAGSWANSIKIAIANKTDFDTGTAEVMTGLLLNNLFSYYPEKENEIGVVIIVDGKVAETFLVSLDPNAKDYNSRSTYVEQVINRQSEYVFVKHNLANKNNPKSSLGANILQMKFGNNGIPSKGDIIDCYNKCYADKETIDIDIVIANEKCQPAVADLCMKRGDVIGIAGAPYEAVVGVSTEKAMKNLLDLRATGEWNMDNKFFMLVANYGYIHDDYNGKYRWVNLAGATAGMRAAISLAYNPWFASAGLNYGVYSSDIIKLAINVVQEHRDQLYKNSMNPVRSMSGIVLWGQKTATSKPSAFDRVNVRMLFNYLERNIARYSNRVLFEMNDDTTRSSFRSNVDSLLRSVQASSGVDNYQIEIHPIKDLNTLEATFLIRPTGVIEFIILNFTAVGQNYQFSGS